MINTFDGSSFKRTGGLPGDRSPAVGFQRLGVQYTAVGGETSINLAALNPQFNYTPGAYNLTVKRTSGGELMAGIDFLETSSTTIGFPSTDPLVAGEIVQVIRDFNVTGVMAVNPRPDVYTATGTAGQTLITADFSWPYNYVQSKGRGAVKVEIHGIAQTRGVDYTEVNLGTSNTNQIQLISPLAGGENICLTPTYAFLDQTAATSTFNSTQLSGIQSALTSGTQGFVDNTNTISVPNTTIVNRAKIPDITNDLRPSFGIERIPIQGIYQLQSEFGPNGEPVWASPNDTNGLIRFIGQWSSVLGTSGQYAQSSTNSGDYIEVTFFGTALNILTLGFSYDIRVSVDGGTEGSNIYPTTQSSILAARNYNANIIIPAASGLALGIHTAKLRVNTTNNPVIYGFEVINANSSTSLNVNPGNGFINGQKISPILAQSVSYNSTFDSGTLALRGGRVVTYLKNDGTIGKALTAANVGPTYLTNTDHTNEEIARVYYPREFGAGRTDDFSQNLQSPGNAALTIDDDSTTLIGSSVAAVSLTGSEGIYNNTTAGFIDFTFLGTGLDINLAGLGTTFDNCTISIDGTVITTTATGSTSPKTLKIVGGLAYGTHTFRLSRNATAASPIAIKSFTVYQYKKPAVLSGALELCDYTIMGNFINNTTAGQDTVSSFVIRKNSSREWTYSGTWTAAFNTGNIGGTTFSSTTNGDYAQYTFFGTGFDLRFASTTTATNFLITVDGSSNLTGSASYGAGISSYTASTGAVATSTTAISGNGVYYTGLSLGIHTVRITKNGGTGAMMPEALDIITPIYSPKSNIYYDLQNALTIGSNALSDNRKTSIVKDSTLQKKNISQATAVTTTPTTTSTIAVPLVDMSVTHVNTTGKIRITYSASYITNTANGQIANQIYVDGVAVSQYRYGNNAVANGGIFALSDTMVVPVSPGVHKIDLYWLVASGQTGTGIGLSRDLLVEEI